MVGGVDQWLGRRSLAGGLSMIYAMWPPRGQWLLAEITLWPPNIKNTGGEATSQDHDAMLEAVAPKRIWKWGAPVRHESGGTGPAQSAQKILLVVPLHFFWL